MKITFENRVFPVPGGPCNKILRYTPLFDLVFLVAIAMSRIRSSNNGCGKNSDTFPFNYNTYSVVIAIRQHLNHDST